MLSDLAKSASDLRQASTKALEQLAEATVPRLRPVLDEVAAVRSQPWGEMLGWRTNLPLQLPCPAGSG